MEDLKPYIEQHPFFKDMKPAHVDLIAGCAHNVSFKAGEYICKEGEPANYFYLIRQGRVVVEASSPPLGVIGLLSVGPGEIFGYHWLFPPYAWSFDYRASELTRALAMDGRCLRGECETDHELGYQLMLRFSEVLGSALEATRQQLLETIHEHHTS